MMKLHGFQSVRSAAGFIHGPETFHFQAANGAAVTVNVTPASVKGDGRPGIQIALEALAQVLRAHAGRSGRRPSDSEGAGACDAGFWSWALPDGWSRPDR